MKLKNKKHTILKPILILIFMFFVCYKTIDYLYKNNNISNEEYIRLLLSDAYKSENNNIYKSIIKLFSNNFNPLKMLQVPKASIITDEYNYNELKTYSKHMNDPNKVIFDKPYVYLYNSHQLESYSKDNTYVYNITPNVMMTSFLLKEKLNKEGIYTIVLDEEIDGNNSFEKSKEYLINNKNKYESIEYYIDIHRSSTEYNLSTITIDGISYARITFIIGTSNPNYKDNYEVSTRLSSRLNEMYPGISRGIIKKEKKSFNEEVDKNVLLIEFGGVENNIDEILNSIDAFSITFKTFIEE